MSIDINQIILKYEKTKFTKGGVFPWFPIPLCITTLETLCTNELRQDPSAGIILRYIDILKHLQSLAIAQHTINKRTYNDQELKIYKGLYLSQVVGYIFDGTEGKKNQLVDAIMKGCGASQIHEFLCSNNFISLDPRASSIAQNYRNLLVHLYSLLFHIIRFYWYFINDVRGNFIVTQKPSNEFIYYKFYSEGLNSIMTFASCDNHDNMEKLKIICLINNKYCPYI